jgi:6-phosphofructokinase 1
MNAATRSVVRCACARGMSVAAIRNGYTGLIAGDIRPCGPRDVGGILHQAGTVLGTTRCETLRTDRGRELAQQALKAHEIGALVVIGGNGSQTGAYELSRRGVPVVGIASTIDNDLAGTDISIGATTAVDVALEAIDRLRSTAASMQRAFLVEVMGRHCGYLALMAGIAGGAEVIVAPEAEVEPAVVAEELRAAFARGKSHAIAVVAEGARHDADTLLRYCREHHERLGFEVRATRLGHTQRGGAPGAFDRMLGTLLGSAAVEAVAREQFGVVVGFTAGRPGTAALADVAGRSRPADPGLHELARMLAQ